MTASHTTMKNVLGFSFISTDKPAIIASLFSYCGRAKGLTYGTPFLQTCTRWKHFIGKSS